MEEQTVTTNEMSRNVEEAAKGSNEIVQNITGAAQAAQSTARGAAQTQAAAQELARLASQLQTVVGQFKYGEGLQRARSAEQRPEVPRMRQPTANYLPTNTTLHAL